MPDDTHRTIIFRRFMPGINGVIVHEDTPIEIPASFDYADRYAVFKSWGEFDCLLERVLLGRALHAEVLILCPYHDPSDPLMQHGFIAVRDI